MRSTITFSIALILSMVILALASSYPRVTADPIRQYTADTGMVTLGPNQRLRMTSVNTASQRSRVTSIAVTFDAVVTFSTCSGGVCTHTVTSETTTAPVTLLPGQAASHDIVPPPGASSVRGTIRSDSPDTQANALIIDNSTGETAGLFRLFGDATGDR